MCQFLGCPFWAEGFRVRGELRELRELRELGELGKLGKLEGMGGDKGIVGAGFTANVCFAP